MINTKKYIKITSIIIKNGYNKINGNKLKINVLLNGKNFKKQYITIYKNKVIV